MRDVAVVSFAEIASAHTEADEIELLVSVISDAIGASGIPRKEIGFTVSGSCDYLGGRPFSFVMALDAVGAWPPISESHVEMDGAWALYEAWVRLQHGDIDSALVYAFGRSSQGPLFDLLATQLDPYYMAPLWPDAVAIAGLQARALLDSGRATERDMAEVAARNLRNARANLAAHVSADVTADDLLRAPYRAAPLREHDCPPISDGASALVLVAGDLARKVSKRPAWIRGIDHRIEAHALGVRDLARSPSTELAARKAGAHGAKVDIVEIHAPFSHQELIVREALALQEGVAINPSGGTTGAHPYIVAGLNRIGAAARQVIEGTARRAVAHATSGPCLQQNMVCLLESE